VPVETCDCLVRNKTFNKNGEYLVSAVIEFLERLGSDAGLRHATNEEVAQALAAAGIEDPARATILGGDRPTLESLLDAKPNVFCGIVAPGEEEQEEQEDEKEDEEKEDEEKDDEEEEDEGEMTRKPGR
jgi:hypothetical protein